MIELLVRLAVAAGVLACSLTLKQPSFDTAWMWCAGFAGFSGFVYLVERQGLRNAGIAGFVAVFDACFIATALSETGHLSSFGFLVLVPMMWATGRFSSDAASMAPLVAATVMVGSNFFENGGFTVPVMLHTVGILIVGLLTGQKKVVVKETQVPYAVERTVAVPSERDGQLEESYRSLKEHVFELEKKGRKERIAMRVYTAAEQSDEPYFSVVAATLAECCGVRGVAVYTYDATQKKMVAQGYAGPVPKSLRDLAFEVPGGLGDGQLRHQVEQKMMRLCDAASGYKAQSVLLKDKGRMVGMAVLWDKSPLHLNDGHQAAVEAAESLGPIVAGELRREAFTRRLAETEILYSVASVTLGAETPQSLVGRVVREIGESIRLDHLAVFFLDGTEALQIASVGATNRLFEDISFAYGPGIEGWLELGAPEVLLADTLDDDRIEKTVAMKRRMGSYLMIPVLVDGKPYGFVSAGMHSASGIDVAKQTTLRAIVAEASQAVNRLVSPSQEPDGVMTPGEFYEAVRKGRNGHLVYFDVLRREENIEKFGKPAFDHALRRLLRELRSKLVAGAALCRREEGDYVAFLPVTDDGEARKWANQVAASASLIGLTTPDGRAKIPLALKAKVAPISTQKHQVSEEKVA